jgi:glycosyltransferase involved in cell wall biosynthesis
MERPVAPAVTPLRNRAPGPLARTHATQQSVSLFLPAWNEEAYVEKTVTLAAEVLAALTRDFEIIVVDDASTDRTGAIADALAAAHPFVRVVHHATNQKLGGSVRSGIAAARKDIVVYSDMDLPFDLWEIHRAVSLLERYEADMVSAYRLDRTSEGARRILYSFAYNLLVRAAFGVAVKDVNFSFKVMRRRVLERIAIRSHGSFIDAEILVKAQNAGFKVIQIGVDYFPRTMGKSTLASPGVILDILREGALLYRECRRR